MKMPFGKYKNQDIEEVPTDYLIWLAEQNPSPVILAHLREELIQRENPGTGKTAKYAKSVFMEKLAELLTKTPDEFISGEWKLKTGFGTYIIRIRKE